MPSRSMIAVIVAFWLGTIGYAFYRDVWPRLVANGPPPLSVDLAEEASPNVSVKWTVSRGDRKIGRLNTHMSYSDADDTFLQIHDFHQLELQFGETTIRIPQLRTMTRVSRSGELREQSMEGKLQAQFVGTTIEAEARVHGTVVDGQFRSRCVLKSAFLDLDQELEPVPVPQGQALNPLQVMSRIKGLQASQHWVVQTVDPLGDAVAAFVDALSQKYPFVPRMRRERDSIIARVSSSPEELEWKGAAHSCWVIEYRGNNDARARTWVRVSDGKVLRQEAFGKGERLTIEREE